MLFSQRYYPVSLKCLKFYEMDPRLIFLQKIRYVLISEAEIKVFEKRDKVVSQLDKSRLV